MGFEFNLLWGQLYAIVLLPERLEFGNGLGRQKSDSGPLRIDNSILIHSLR